MKRFDTSPTVEPLAGVKWTTQYGYYRAKIAGWLDLHEDRLAMGSFNIPCAPGSRLPACSQCLGSPRDSGLRKQMFEKYASAHAGNIAEKRAADEYWRRP